MLFVAINSLVLYTPFVDHSPPLVFSILDFMLCMRGAPLMSRSVTHDVSAAVIIIIIIIIIINSNVY